jgi:hypothetical protein
MASLFTRLSDRDINGGGKLDLAQIPCYLWGSSGLGRDKDTLPQPIGIRPGHGYLSLIILMRLTVPSTGS